MRRELHGVVAGIALAVAGCASIPAPSSTAALLDPERENPVRIDAPGGGSDAATPGDVRSDAVVGLAAGAGFPEFLWLQGGPLLGPVSLDLRFGVGIFDLYLGGGLTTYVPLTPNPGVSEHALALSARYMRNLEPKPDRDATHDGDDSPSYELDLDFDGPDWTTAVQAGWVGTAAFGLQGRALIGVGSLERRRVATVDLGIGWVF